MIRNLYLEAPDLHAFIVKLMQPYCQKCCMRDGFFKQSGGNLDMNADTNGVKPSRNLVIRFVLARLPGKG